MDTAGHKMAENLKWVYDQAETSGHNIVDGDDDDDLT